MNENAMADFINELLASLMQTLYSSHKTLEGMLMDKSLSVPQLNCVKLLNNATSGMYGACNVSHFLINSGQFEDELDLRSFSADDLFCGLIEAFKKTVLEYYSPKVSYQSKLPIGFPVMVDKQKFEFIVFNMFFCCLRNAPVMGKGGPKITLYVMENKEYNIFRIKDDNECIAPEIIEAVFGDERIEISRPEYYDEPTLEKILTLTLKTVYKTILRLGGKMEYSPLKHGNRFNIYLPNYSKRTIHYIHKASVYTPSFGICREIFAPLMLENTLRELAEKIETPDGKLI